jgi:hypothetical protein
MFGLRRILIGGVGALAAGTLVLGAVSALQGGSAGAQEATTTPTATPKVDGAGHLGRFGFGFGLGRGGNGTFLADLAAKLNITEDQLRTAIDAVENDHLSAAVAAGDITQAQADAIQARRAEIEAAIANGTLGDLMKQQLQDRMKARLDQAVTNGDITQAQEDQILQAITDGNLQQVLQDLGLQGLRLFGGGRFGRGGFGPGGPGGGPGFFRNGGGFVAPTGPGA